MMKIKRQTIMALDRLQPDDMMIVHQLVLKLQRYQQDGKKVETSLNPSVRVRKILQHCNGSMSEDIVAEREERI